VLDRGRGPLVSSDTKQNETSSPLFLATATQLTEDSGPCTEDALFRLTAYGLVHSAKPRYAIFRAETEKDKREGKRLF
jgi:hypothetical protein